jgi:hypothetical protein
MCELVDKGGAVLNDGVGTFPGPMHEGVFHPPNHNEVIGFLP